MILLSTISAQYKELAGACLAEMEGWCRMAEVAFAGSMWDTATITPLNIIDLQGLPFMEAGASMASSRQTGGLHCVYKTADPCKLQPSKYGIAEFSIVHLSQMI